MMEAIDLGKVDRDTSEIRYRRPFRNYENYGRGCNGGLNDGRGRYNVHVNRNDANATET
jgi:hypothetical protein